MLKGIPSLHDEDHGELKLDPRSIRTEGQVAR